MEYPRERKNTCIGVCSNSQNIQMTIVKFIRSVCDWNGNWFRLMFPEFQVNWSDINHINLEPFQLLKPPFNVVFSFRLVNIPSVGGVLKSNRENELSPKCPFFQFRNVHIEHRCGKVSLPNASSFILLIYFFKVNTPEQVLPSAFPVIAFSSPWHAMIFRLI